MIYQYQARGVDQAITSAIDTHLQAELDKGMNSLIVFFVSN
jgi:hypothetical protein